ncbi:hypothetical protein M413DRAFT_176220 [Hebeloma cylindrosporum]|uniref:Uncharacterized protein n=1 Tax=Hebeloma cylindrosporum TaxID=76867 RepID=A0A0C3C9N4_HEBCY|nr:hypothetical protein M413DRAFT_176220 [Hebeloma cylindrosporum h7]
MWHDSYSRFLSPSGSKKSTWVLMVPPHQAMALHGRGKITSDRNVDAERRQIGGWKENSTLHMEERIERIRVISGLTSIMKSRSCQGGTTFMTVFRTFD